MIRLFTHQAVLHGRILKIFYFIEYRGKKKSRVIMITVTYFTKDVAYPEEMNKIRFDQITDCLCIEKKTYLFIGNAQF